MVYIGDWSNRDDILEVFALDLNTLDDCEILLAVYDSDFGGSSAYVLFIDNEGNLRDSYAQSDDSDLGLEGEWDEELTDWGEVLEEMHRGFHRSFYNSREVKERLIYLVDKYTANVVGVGKRIPNKGPDPPLPEGPP